MKVTSRRLRTSARKAPALSPAAPPDPGPPWMALSPSIRALPTAPASGTDPRDVAAELLRTMLAPPLLDELAGDTMLAVASVPGKVPEEWRAAGFLWVAWPHAADAWVHAAEMTAAQLRDLLAGRDSHA